VTLNEFNPHGAPDPDWIRKFLRYFVQIDLLEKSEVRTLFMLIFDSMGEYITSKEEFDNTTFVARLTLPAMFMRGEVNRRGVEKPPRGVPVSNPLWLSDFPGFQRPALCLSRQPTGRQRPAARERSGSAAAPPESAARAARGAALTPYRKFSTALLLYFAAVRASKRPVPILETGL
jgi:hypothetical protein